MYIYIDIAIVIIVPVTKGSDSSSNKIRDSLQ